ncbi:hypothetical protein [Spirillospora sp. NBC_01491]|uniref:hypothetical protein n=1 Tax=Spirillospora sp. NBC_01491 TaxID=2976007 RepID=UPI002E358944|nr:hypothetical protein [Spirillospora sp. NBC_01491]
MAHQPHTARENTTTDDGMHDCARGDHCAARKTVVAGGERIIIPAQTYRTHCETCQDRIHDVLEDLPARYRDLNAALGHKARTDAVRVSGGGSTRPVPINLGVEALLRQADEVLLSWHERVADRAGLTPITARYGTPAVTARACTTLAGHVTALLALDAADMARSMDLARAEYLPADAYGWVHPAGEWIHYNTALGGEHAGVEILNLHHRTLKLLGHAPQHHDLITACWECGERKLRRHDGSAGLADHVECLRCREQYLAGRLRSLMVEEDQAQQRRVERERRRSDPSRVILAGTREGTGGRS